MSRGRRVSQVVLVLADGIGADYLEPLLDGGSLPALARLARVPAGRPMRRAASVFPSTTGPAHLPFLTGRFPGPCNIPGIRWFDPERYGRRALGAGRFRSYMGLGSYMAAGDLSPEVRTMFELVADHACIGGHVRRGVGRGRNLTRWSKAVTSLTSFLSEDWTRSDRIAALRLLTSVERGTPFVFASFYGTDAAAHKWGGGPQMLDGCRRVDEAVGAVVAHLDRTGRGDETLLLVVSDHGHSDTYTHLDLHAIVERVIGPTLAHPKIWRGYFGGAAASVMVSGNAMAHVYLRGDRWVGPQAYESGGREQARLIDALVAEPAVDQIIVRDARGGALVVSARGRAQIRLVDGQIVYEPEAGGDPFGYPPAIAGRRTRQDWLASTWETDYPDAPVQVLQLVESPRSGHVIVTARPGFDLRARFEKPPHRGSHGSLHRAHMMTPLLSNLPLAEGPARTVDVMPTMLDALGIAPPAIIDGRSLWPLSSEAGR